jgi:NMD3 family
LTNTILEQVFEIEYLVQHGQCPDCAKLAAKNTWKAVVQVRQKVSHKRTFLYLEQLILKHNAQKDTISIKEVRDGLDFFYTQRSHALKMVELLASVAPVKYMIKFYSEDIKLTLTFPDQKRQNNCYHPIPIVILPHSSTPTPLRSSPYAKMISSASL